MTGLFFQAVGQSIAITRLSIEFLNAKGRSALKLNHQIGSKETGLSPGHSFRQSNYIDVTR
jgi:hypothetical protein